VRGSGKSRGRPKNSDSKKRAAPKSIAAEQVSSSSAEKQPRRPGPPRKQRMLSPPEKHEEDQISDVVMEARPRMTMEPVPMLEFVLNHWLDAIEKSPDSFLRSLGFDPGAHWMIVKGAPQRLLKRDTPPTPQEVMTRITQARVLACHDVPGYRDREVQGKAILEIIDWKKQKPLQRGRAIHRAFKESPQVSGVLELLPNSVPGIPAPRYVTRRGTYLSPACHRILVNGDRSFSLHILTLAEVQPENDSVSSAQQVGTSDEQDEQWVPMDVDFDNLELPDELPSFNFDLINGIDLFM